MQCRTSRSRNSGLPFGTDCASDMLSFGKHLLDSKNCFGYYYLNPSNQFSGDAPGTRMAGGFRKQRSKATFRTHFKLFKYLPRNDSMNILRVTNWNLLMSVGSLRAIRARAWGVRGVPPSADGILPSRVRIYYYYSGGPEWPEPAPVCERGEFP